jgi:hypothetical protein
VPLSTMPARLWAAREVGVRGTGMLMEGGCCLHGGLRELQQLVRVVQVVAEFERAHAHLHKVSRMFVYTAWQAQGIERGLQCSLAV